MHPSDLADADRPRVLILSGEIPQTRLAGAIVLHRLFSGYPPGRVFVIGPRPVEDAGLLPCPYRELWMPLRRLENSRLSMHKRSLTACGLVPLPSHRRVMKALGAFTPDVVVSVMANTPWMVTAERTARRLGIPLVLIIHDLNEEFEKVFPWARGALFRANRRVYRSADRRLCVSPEMAAYLAGRYEAPGEVMYPNRSEDLVPRPVEDSLVLKDPRRLTLGYAGSVAYGYGEALVDLIPVLREVGARILLSTPKPPDKLRALLEASDVVEWMPHRSEIGAMWREMQERADVMILPYAFDARANDLLYRTHFPSKLTEYLGLGMPVVVSGPDFATGLAWARGEGLGSIRPRVGETSGRDFDVGHESHDAPNGVVTCASRESLASGLATMKRDGTLRCRLAERAVVSGMRDFDPRRIRGEFLSILQAVARAVPVSR